MCVCYTFGIVLLTTKQEKTKDLTSTTDNVPPCVPYLPNPAVSFSMTRIQLKILIIELLCPTLLHSSIQTHMRVLISYSYHAHNDELSKTS